MTQREEAEVAFVDAALEERLGAAAPPDLTGAILRACRGSSVARNAGASVHAAAAARTRRTPLFAAVVVLGGIAVVGGVAIATRGSGSGTALSPQQEPKPDRPAGAMDAAAHFPLALGNRWEYREVCGDTNHDVTVVVTARVPMQDVVIAQLTTIGADRSREPAFAFWSADAQGVRLHASDSLLVDPIFSPCNVDGVVLPSPVGAEAKWGWRTLPPKQLPRGVAAGGRRRTPDPIECTATLLGVGEKLQIGEQTFSCVHVRVDSALPAGNRVEHLFFARGIGIVRRTWQTGEEPEVCRELVRFLPAMPPPDRNHVLALSLGDASKGCSWIDRPATDDAAWTLRSEFAIETRPDGVRFHRIFGDKVGPFDPTSLADFEALARDEDFGPRMEGLFPQRMTVGLARLLARLRAAQLGQRFERDNGMSVEIGPGSSKVTLPVLFTAPDGSTSKHEIVVRTSNAIPTAVLFDGR
ncbi:MAG TPA: hypothetical protein VFD82_11240 [Planctomycetota bacterium]|nr:hypothetical protein [Planctomycetota bacterium]